MFGVIVRVKNSILTISLLCQGVGEDIEIKIHITGGNNMLNILESIKECLEGIELNNLTIEQKKSLSNRYNTMIRFEYGTTKYNEMVLKMNKDYFGSMEYYYGSSLL